jgi:hypothetical protein
VQPGGLLLAQKTGNTPKSYIAVNINLNTLAQKLFTMYDRLVYKNNEHMNPPEVALGRGV